MSSHLIGQLMHEQKIPKPLAEQVAMLQSLAEAGRPLKAAARAVGLSPKTAGSLAARFNITFVSGGPA